MSDSEPEAGPALKKVETTRSADTKNELVKDRDTNKNIKYEDNPLIYFIPPVTNALMLWGESTTIVLFVLLLFFAIIMLYIYINISNYQNSVNLMANAYLFGYIPQDQFVKYIKNTQHEAIAAAMDNIQTNSENINVNANRLDDNTTLLSRQMSNDVMNKSNVKTNKIGNETKGMIGNMLDGIQKALVNFNLSRYVNGNTVATTQPPLLSGSS
jgi:hypothetical protein